MATTSRRRAKPDRARRAFIYCRISLDRVKATDERGAVVIGPDGRPRRMLKVRGEGVERQREACREVAKREGWTVVEEIVENDRSASRYARKPRPEFQRMLARLEQGEADAIVFYDLSRLSRQSKEVHDVIAVSDAHDVALASAHGKYDLSSPMGRLHLKILADFAEMSSDEQSDRIGAWHDSRRRRGVPNLSGRVFGYESDWRKIHETEGDLVREIVRRAIAGETPYAVARWLNATGVRTVKGRDWQETGVRHLATNPRYAALVEHNGQILEDVQAQWPAIVDRASWEQACRMWPRKTGRRRGRPGSFLTGLVRCAHCESNVMWKSGGTYKQYRCLSKRGAAARSCLQSVGARQLDDVVVAAILEVVGDRPTARQKGKGKSAPRFVDVAALRRDVVTLAEDFGAGRLTKDEWQAAKAGLERRIRAAEVAATPIPQQEKVGRDLLALPAGRLRAEWEGLAIEQKKAVAAVLIERIEVRRGRVGGRGLDLDRVEIVWRA